MTLRPYDTSAHHDWREACLIDQDCVLHNREIHIGDLEDVPVQIAFKDALSRALDKIVCPRTKVRFARAIFEAESRQMGSLRLGSFEKGGCVNELSDENTGQL